MKPASSGRPDVVIAGAGPAGSVAALLLARAGARVQLLDRAAFPRDKLCGDTINPGAIAILRRLGVAASLEAKALPIDGMMVTGPGRVQVRGRYQDHPRAGATAVEGWSLRRRELDAALVAAAMDAGVQFDDRVVVRGPMVADDNGRPRVQGLVVRGPTGRSLSLPALVTVAADGRRSVVSTRLGLSRSIERPRRWAVGGYFDGVTGVGAYGEMHVRHDHYIGVSPVPGGSTNVCVVSADRTRFARPEQLLHRALARDSLLLERFVEARLMTRPVSIGPMGVVSHECGCAGLLLAGDAAGFIDPITGDGVRFALHGGELAARAAQWMLEAGRQDGHTRLAGWRQRAFAGKWRFNRAVRALVGSATGVTAGALGAALAPWVLQRVVAYAGDVGLVEEGGVSS